MLSIDEAIAREREMAEMHRNDIVPKEDYHNMPWVDMNNEASMRNAEEHEQLAEWLEELKELRNMTAGHLYAVAFNMGYLKEVGGWLFLLCGCYGDASARLHHHFSLSSVLGISNTNGDSTISLVNAKSHTSLTFST